MSSAEKEAKYQALKAYTNDFMKGATQLFIQASFPLTTTGTEVLGLAGAISINTLKTFHHSVESKLLSESIGVTFAALLAVVEQEVTRERATF